MKGPLIMFLVFRLSGNGHSDQTDVTALEVDPACVKGPLIMFLVFRLSGNGHSDQTDITAPEVDPACVKGPLIMFFVCRGMDTATRQTSQLLK